ncbi:hypothetical protein PPERSA_09712 [Pseudocohnilembus persalinus]|uniref:ClpP/crotonase-like domain n=1 Tax=Pseudocohnilembus persalinus TaxID=266149 RepID=A0A0V0QV55_PSEPJ|nr:hypothetical protein PPERSA_09712 [Pseudocohnilembus persalinus]|eukprot:KRX06100.1 hypothetical protein PPERSA_09712 [Pseudocohnilembus persalinus]
MADRLQKLQQELSQNQQKTELEFADEGRIGIIYLNSPKELNALSDQMRYEISTKINALSQNDQVKVIVILSKCEKAFCAGANIKEFSDLTYEKQNIQDKFYNLDRALSDCVKPIVAGVNGYALGGGLEVALACDIIILQEGAKLGLPELSLGLIPGLGGNIRLTNQIGQYNASRLILSGEMISAEKALHLGLGTEILKKENFQENVINFAKKISAKSMTALIAAKKSILSAQEQGLSQAIKTERQLFNPLFYTQGKQEGVDAFLNKRKPNFNKC